jgi:hypothetical protein
MDKLIDFLLQFTLFKTIYDRNGTSNFKEIAKNIKLKTYSYG